MRSTNLIAKLLPRAVFAGLINAVSMAGAARAELAPQFTDNPAENRLVLAVEASPAMSGTKPVVLGARLGHQAMVYRFRVQAHRGPETAPGSRDAWEITVHSALTGGAVAGPMRSLAQLSLLRPDVTLPRPLGYLLGRADSVVVVVRILDYEAAPMALTVTIDYEPLNAAFSRLAVQPHLANGVTTTGGFAGVAADQSRTRVWEWTPSVSGRVLAVAGAQFAEAREIVLADAETGEVLRRVARAGRAQSGEAPGGPGFMLMPASVQAGHTYRLTVFYGEAGPEAARGATELVHALVLPGVETP